MEKKIDELLERLVEEKVKDYLNNILLREIVEKTVEKLISKEVVSYLKSISATNDFFKSKIDAIMNEPIATDDGWGNKKIYSNFEELFKKTLKEKLDNTYEIKNTIRQCVEERINNIVKTQSKEMMAKVENQILIELGDK